MSESMWESMSRRGGPSILKTGKAKAIRSSTLAPICRELECQLGNLLTYQTE